ncbi:hypothetical protein ACSSV1_003008 [Labrenzia sp. MBR-25]
MSALTHPRYGDFPVLLLNGHGKLAVAEGSIHVLFQTPRLPQKKDRRSLNQRDDSNTPVLAKSDK